jgi:hypothetical protein
MTADAVYTSPDIAPEAYIAALEEIAAMGQEGPDFRANVPAGTVLGEEGISGSDGRVQYRKRQSLLRAGQRQLPERVMLWNKMTGRGSMVPPTLATKRVMQGTKQFPASAFTLRDPGFPKPEPIEEHCWVCDKKREIAGNPPRDFFDVIQYEAHMELMHPREWSTHLRQAQQRERLEDREAQRDFIMEIVRAMRPEVLANLDTEAAEEQIADEVERRRGRPRRAPDAG